MPCCDPCEACDYPTQGSCSCPAVAWRAFVGSCTSFSSFRLYIICGVRILYWFLRQIILLFQYLSLGETETRVDFAGFLTSISGGVSLKLTTDHRRYPRPTLCGSPPSEIFDLFPNRLPHTSPSVYDEKFQVGPR